MNQIFFELQLFSKITNTTDKVKLNGGAKNDLIVNGQYFDKGGVNVTINGGAGNDTITNSGSYSKINGGAGNDLIHNGYYYYEPYNYYYDNSGNDGEYDDTLKSSHTTITSGKGDDTIYNRGDYVVINAGAGDDYIENFGKNVLVNVGGGSDTVEGDNITISGSSSDDTITGSAGKQIFRYKSGGGDDVITNYSGEDVILRQVKLTAILLTVEI